MSRREPLLQSVAIADLRPTQMTIGFREVAEKRREWREQAEQNGPEFLARHMIPVLIGPKGRFYVTDHHHLARTLQEEGVKDVTVNAIANLSRLSKAEFWVFCDNRGWCHPYNADGERRNFDDLPTCLADLADDPFRSLAGELRRAGGYAKDTAPFSEFIWADFLRRRIKRKAVEEDFGSALTKALRLAKLPTADHLPGWCGPLETASA